MPKRRVTTPAQKAAAAANLAKARARKPRGKAKGGASGKNVQLAVQSTKARGYKVKSSDIAKERAYSAKAVKGVRPKIRRAKKK